MFTNLKGLQLGNKIQGNTHQKVLKFLKNFAGMNFTVDIKFAKFVKFSTRKNKYL